MAGATAPDLEWLADLHKSQCFTTCELSRPAKTLDFGANGFTASLTDWHELLQLTCPDSTCGVVFARGRFPDSAGSILSRAQRRDDSGAKGALGTILLAPDPTVPSDLALGERKAQGWINFRWPYTQYDLVRDNERSLGTCECVSFVRNNTVYQIARLKWGHGSSLSDFDADAALEKATVRVRVGGATRFGCPCSGSDAERLDKDRFRVERLDGGTRLSCTSQRYQVCLDVQFSENGIAQQLAPGCPHNGRAAETVDLSTEHRVELSIGEPYYLVSSYTLRRAEEELVAPEALDLQSLTEYLGVRRDSVHMTDRLWTALCSANYEGSEAVELCIVGRCVEQILGVSAVPLGGSAKCDDPKSDPRLGMAEAALIRNIMTSQYVDVQSAFFQIRLLAKVYNFIRTRVLDDDLLQPFRSLEDIRQVYLDKIKSVICSSLAWLFNSDLKPGKLLLAVPSQFNSSREPDETDVDTAPSSRLASCIPKRQDIYQDISYNRGGYAAMAAWLVLSQCPGVICPGVVRNEPMRAFLLSHLPAAYRVGQDRAYRDKQPSAKSNVLQLLSLSCLLMLAKDLGSGRKVSTDEELPVEEVRETQERFTKAVSRLKSSSSGGWTLEHEELDRVILLGDELDLRGFKASTSLLSSRAQLTRRRIRDRKRTTKVNTGPESWMAARGLSNGPWELLCMNHESYLRVAEDSSLISARERLLEFLLADYSFMASWDRADTGMIGTWWDMEPVSIICATLIDLKMEGKLPAARTLQEPADDDEAAPDAMASSLRDVRRPSMPMAVAIAEDSQTALIRNLILQLKQMQEESNQAQIQQFQSQQSNIGDLSNGKALAWIRYKPETLFHPDWWIQSLDDTPEIFRSTNQTRDVQLRKNLSDFLKSQDSTDLVKDPNYTVSNVKQKIKQNDLSLLDVFDIYHQKDFSFTLRRDKCSPEGSRDRRVDQQEAGMLPYGKMMERLNDSPVDVGPKHRILFANNLSAPLVGGFIYLWHPDALDTIDDHFGTMSRFSDTREASMWSTAITLSHWIIRPSSHFVPHGLREKHRSNGDFPPDSIADLGVAPGERHVVEERSSSLVITGDPAGNLWICTLWSSVTEADGVARVIERSIPNVLKRFIHQQAGGRCLVFLVLLGHICEGLAKEYERIIQRLDEIMEIGEKVLLEGLEWGTDEAVNKLKKMLWGLEALRVFNDRLSTSMSQIQRAQDAMERAIRQDETQQHIDLAQEYSNSIEELKKRYGRLADVQDKIQVKIRQVTGLRDGISTVTNVQDSQTALQDSKTTIRQGNNIRTLTYITIAYLPLGFVTGLFSISHGTFMDEATDITFAVLIVIFSITTYVLAFSLDRALQKWLAIPRSKWHVGGRGGKPAAAYDEEGGSKMA